MSKQEKEKIVKLFCDDCIWIYAVRQHFRDLYESGEERRNLLAEISQGFFGDLNVILQEYILLQKAKITDPASSGKNKDNLTSNYLASMEWDPDVKAKLDLINVRLMSFRKKIVEARKKYLAHSDLKSHLMQKNLGSFTENEEDDFWEALQEFVNVAHGATFEGPYPINAVLQNGDVQSLIHSLIEAEDYKELVENDSDFLHKRLGNRRYENA